MQSLQTRWSPRRPAEYASIAARGFAMGAADIVPGVSGGTMAFILGIYEQLVDGIAAITRRTTWRLAADRRWSELLEVVPVRFFAALGIGILAAVFTLSRWLEWLLVNRPVFLWAFFFGLVLASVVVIGRGIRWRPGLVAAGVAAAAGAWLLVGLVPTRTPDTWWSLILSGALAICAMILPGISGSFILLLLGKYATILAAVNTRDVVTLGLVATGAGIGILTFARLVSWLFDRHHGPTVAALTGLMLGSLRKVWPWKETVATTLDRHGQAVPLVEHNYLPRAYDTGFFVAIAIGLIGFGLVLTLERLASRKSSS